MKKLLYVLMACLMLASCNGEDALIGDYVYPGPVPPIPDGPAEAQKICYDLYQKYDITVYYTLEGDEALKTETSELQTNGVSNPDALPVQLPDEGKALNHLKLMQQIYDILPPKMMEKTYYRRQVLVKIRMGGKGFFNTDGENYYDNTFSEDQIGILYFGDLIDTVNVDNEILKYNILSRMFLGNMGYHGYWQVPEPFKTVSDGYYYGDDKNLCFPFNEETRRRDYIVQAGYEAGFVHPMGARCYGVKWCDDDLASYCTWILTEPMDSINEILAEYPMVEEKYNIVCNYLEKEMGFNIADFRAKYANIK